MAEKVAEEQIKPLAQRVADEAEPRTKEATQQYLRNPAKQVAEQVRSCCRTCSLYSPFWRLLCFQLQFVC